MVLRVIRFCFWVRLEHTLVGPGQTPKRGAVCAAAVVSSVGLCFDAACAPVI
ncbi:hypothetical protein DB30_04848 [Enhygromyxa salina]|uniref:Uncharacterized protein n=1 Tax=Enhygromyxa salina TaxID=215803 RepID=A0A0C2CZ67_9BACT|nr:hypothetical protein DB30_04848 [Enhygromyxa salina]